MDAKGLGREEKDMSRANPFWSVMSRLVVHAS